MSNLIALVVLFWMEAIWMIRYWIIIIAAPLLLYYLFIKVKYSPYVQKGKGDLE